MKITNSTKKSIAKAILAISTIILTLGLITAISIPASAAEATVDDEVLTRHVSNIHTIKGYFDTSFKCTNMNKLKLYYRFRSYDDTVWWLLTEEELGYIPEPDTTYYFTYDDKGTTDCDCPEEYDCDCFAYDDEYITCEPEPEISEIVYYISYIFTLKFN